MKNVELVACKSSKNTIEHKILVNNINVIFTDANQTLLECLEAENIEVHYHCRDGYCGACRITLNQGAVTYPNGDPLAYVGKDEILPCCCLPISDLRLTID